MALAIGKADHIRVLSDLSGDVVGALLDEDERRSSEGDPFAIALKRCQEEGHPLEITEAWRRTIAPQPVLASERAAKILRLLARDLLNVVAAPKSESAAVPEPEQETPPANVRPITGPAAPVPALELASDGTWKPSASAARTEELESGRRPAYVPTLGSRYPVPAPARAHVDLPPPPVTVIPAMDPTPPQATPSTTATPTPGASVTEPPAQTAPRPEASAPRVARTTDDESVIQAVAAGIEVVAGPFARFQQLAEFVKAMRDVPGVQNVQTRQFIRGNVHLRVRHAPGVDLAQGLLGIEAFRPTLVSSSATRIELEVHVPAEPPAES